MKKQSASVGDSRFWKRVDKKSYDECWMWTGRIRLGDYGVFRRDTRYGPDIRAHRWSYEIHYGPIPEAMCVCHRCDNRLCVNPKHLFLGTYKDNHDDMVRKGRGSQPPHPLGENHFNAKLNDSDILSIRDRRKNGESAVSIAKSCNVTATTISKIVKRQAWKHLR